MNRSVVALGIVFVAAIVFSIMSQGGDQNRSLAGRNASTNDGENSNLSLDEQLGLAALKSEASGKKGINKEQISAASAAIKDSAGKLFGGSSGSADEISVPVTVKLTKDGNSWKLTGLEFPGMAQEAKGSGSRKNLNVTPSKVEKINRTDSPANQPGSTMSASASPASNLAAQDFAVYFLPGTADIGPKGREVLSESAKVYSKAQSKKIVLNGFTDSSAPESTSTNHLGELRAQNVRKALIAFGVPAESIAIGEIGISPDGENSKQKRRVEISLR